MKMQTRFGCLEIDTEEIIHFPEGILGFTDYHDYVVVNQKDSFFSFLQSVQEPDLTFVIIMPELLRADYQVVLEEAYVKQLKLTDAHDGKVYAIVTVPEDVAEMTANLQAPIIINAKDKLGKQVVLMDGKYHTRHNILAEMHKSAFEKNKQEKELRKTV